MELSDTILCFGGFVLAHAARIASVLEEGELICPFAVITKDDRRQTIDFESESQAESVARGKASLDEYRDQVDFWSLAREGLHSIEGSDQPKVDVLLVSVWTHGMSEPIELMQRFRPAHPGPFALLGPIELYVEQCRVNAESAAILHPMVMEGVRQHPRGDLWATWLVH